MLQIESRVHIMFETTFGNWNDAYTYARVQFPMELSHVGYVVCRLHNTVRVFIYYYRLKAVCEV